MKPISEQTGISIGVLISLLSCMVLGTTWAVRLEGRMNVSDSRMDYQSERIKSTQDSTEVYIKLLQEVNVRLSRIEGRLGIDGKKDR